MNQERRRAPRYPEPGHLWWSRLGETFQEHGWIADRSSHGVSFITPFARRLVEGQTLLISSHEGPKRDQAASSERFAVQRVTPYDDVLSIVACVRTSSQKPS